MSNAILNNITNFTIVKHPYLDESIICFHGLDTREKIDGLTVSELDNLIDLLQVCKQKMIAKNHEISSHCPGLFDHYDCQSGAD
jgi:hypothetical protein